MPDRRQGDRRESSGLQNKKITISLSTFISVIIIGLLIISSIILCRISFIRGYDQGCADTYSSLSSDYDYIDENNN